MRRVPLASVSCSPAARCGPSQRVCLLLAAVAGSGSRHRKGSPPSGWPRPAGRRRPPPRPSSAPPAKRGSFPLCRPPAQCVRDVPSTKRATAGDCSSVRARESGQSTGPSERPAQRCGANTARPPRTLCGRQTRRKTDNGPAVKLGCGRKLRRYVRCRLRIP